MFTIVIAVCLFALSALLLRSLTRTPLRDQWRSMVRPLLCRVLGLHHRDSHRIRKIEHGYTSRCRYCRAPMQKEGREGPWRVVAGEEADELPAPDLPPAAG